MTQEEAIEQINKCMKVLYYRDARCINKVRPTYMYASSTPQFPYP